MGFPCEVIRRIVSDSVTSGSKFGSCIVPVCDYDGDGWTDYAVGGYSNSTGGLTTGSVWIVSGQSGNIIQAIHGHALGEEFGFSIAAIRDLDGDGQRDLAIGAPGADDVVIVGSAEWSTLNTVHSNARGGFGSEVVSAIDLAPNLILIGAPRGPGVTCPGYCAVHDLVQGTTVYVAGSGLERLGSAIEWCGDVTGDGKSEFAVGANGWASSRGRIRLYDGSTFEPMCSIEGVEYGERFGSALLRVDAGKSLGCLLAVGAPGGGEDRGRIYVYRIEPRND
jgi:hypothetical protein